MKSALLAGLLAMPVVIPASASAPSIAGRTTAEREHTFTVALPAAEAFVLFEPVGEKNWAENWQPVFVSAADARLHNGSVFTVERAGHGGSGPVTSVWTITHYERGRLIEYFNVLPLFRATRITVACEPAGAHATRVSVRYAYRSLSAEGDAMVAAITDDSYRAMIDGWGKAIADYLRRGTPASP